MAYKYTNQKGKDYYLHHRQNGTRTLYFFKSEQGEGGMDEVPAGYMVSETGNGLPVLKKEGGGEGGAAKSGSGAKASGGAKSGGKTSSRSKAKQEE